MIKVKCQECNKTTDIPITRDEFILNLVAGTPLPQLSATEALMIETGKCTECKGELELA